MIISPSPPALPSLAQGHSTRSDGSIKRNQIVPAGPSLDQLPPRTDGDKAKPDVVLSFMDVFGLVGVPMLLVLLVCVAWTTWLIFAALAPNEAANLLMGTTDYDNGQFWLIVDPNPHMAVAGAIGLVIVDLCYLYVALKMLFWRGQTSTLLVLEQIGERLAPWSAIVSSSHSWWSIAATGGRRSHGFWKELTAFNGKHRKLWNVILKLFDFGMQLMVLHQLLENGSPVILTMGFAAFLAANSLSCAVSIVLVTHSALAEVVVDLMFDLIAAVVYPILVLLYCYLTFAFDRQVYLTYLETLPVGAFERLARMFANPSEIALFRVSFDSLRIESFLDFVLRIGLNLSFCYRFKRVMDVRALIRRQTCLFLREHGRKPCKSPQTQQKAVPKAIAVALFAFSVAVLVYTHQAIVSSEQTCSVYPECVVHAYRLGASSDVCPCIILIDVDRAPMMYDQWIHPVDAYDKVKALAAPGMLKSLQLINRQLLEWPEELRTCRHLKTIFMLYTSTTSVPSWAKEFQHLETFDLVGKQSSQNLLNLPEDLFIAMPRLAWLHIGVHNQLTKVPPLSGVPNLRILVLAWMFALKEVPSFDYVPNLQSLFMIYLPILERLPDMSPLRSLVEFSIAGSSHICCNGFRGVCDLTDTFCVANLPNGIPGAICLEDKTDPSRAITPFLGNADTERVFEAFAPAICQKTPVDSVVYSNIPTKETIEMCSGKPFRQCYLSDGSAGICFNTRMQVLSCFANEDYIALRRLQIQKEVGLPCDPEEEKWLGCSE